MIAAQELFVRSFAEAKSKGMEPIIKERSRIRMTEDTLTRMRKNRFAMQQLSGIIEEVDTWAACPALLLGAGPSLRQHFDMLQRVPPTWCTLAVDTALPALHNVGFAPHYTGVIEMNPAQAQLWRYLEPELFKRTVMIVPNYIDGVVHQSWPGPVRMFNVWGTARENELQQEWGKDLGLVNNIRTISTTLLYVAVAILGCDPVILAGHDCAFRPSEDYYAGHVPSQLQPKLDDDVAVEDSLGRPLLAADGQPTQTNRSLWINKTEMDRMGRDLLALDDTRRLWSLDASTLLDTWIWKQTTWGQILQACGREQTHNLAETTQ